MFVGLNKCFIYSCYQKLVDICSKTRNEFIFMSSKFSNSRKNWRIRVLDRLNDARDVLSTNLSSEELESLYKLADKYNEDKQMEIYQQQTDNSAVEGRFLPDNSKKSQPIVLFRSENSFLQFIETNIVPYHLQVVVPAASGTNFLNNAQTLELNTWFRSLSMIALQEDISLIFFEFSTGSMPLIVDIFPVPADLNEGSMQAQWKSVLEEDADDFDSTTIKRLRTHIQKGEFPQKCPYVAVTFDNLIGFGRIYQGGYDPSTAALEVVQAIWTDSNSQPPEKLIETIKEYSQWPR